MHLSEIVVGERIRKDLGSIDEVVTSIQELGLLHPILIQAGSNKLIDGYRRLKALETMGYSELPEDWVRIVEMEGILRGEFDANMIRKAFLPSEIAEIAEALKEEITEKNRQISIDAGKVSGNLGKDGGNQGSKYGSLGGRGITKGSEKYEAAKNTDNPYMSNKTDEKDNPVYEDSEDNSEDTFEDLEAPEPDLNPAPATTKTKTPAHKTREELTDKLGYSQPTLDKIMAIKKAAGAEPKLYEHLLEKMDEDGKIEPAYQHFLIIKAGVERKHYDMSDELLALRSDKGKQLMDCVVKAFLFLPQVTQAGLIKKYGDYCFLIKQSTYDRGMKNNSPIKSTDAATLNEMQLLTALEDILIVTKEEYEQWIYFDQMANISSTVYNVIESKGREISTIEKLEFFAVGLGIFTGCFLKYMKLASREKLIDSTFPTELADGTLEIFKRIIALHDNGIITRLAVKRKKDLGGIEGIEIKQDVMHSANISEDMIKHEDDLLYHIKRLSAVMGEKTAKVAERIVKIA